MHHRGREPPGSGPGGGGTNPFTGRGLPSVRSPYRPSPSNNRAGSSSNGGGGTTPNVTNMMKKAMLILLSFILFFVFIGSGVDEEYVPKQQSPNEYTIAIDSIATMKNDSNNNNNRVLDDSSGSMSRFDKRKKKKKINNNNNDDGGIQKEPTKLILPPQNINDEVSQEESSRSRTQEIGFGNSSFEEGGSKSRRSGNGLPEYLNLHDGGVNDMNLHVDEQDNTNTNNLGLKSEEPSARKFDGYEDNNGSSNASKDRSNYDDTDGAYGEKKTNSDAYLGFGGVEEDGSSASQKSMNLDNDWSGENEAPPSRDGLTPRSNDSYNHDSGKYHLRDNDISEDVSRVAGGGLRGGKKDDVHSRSSRHDQFGRGYDSDEQQDRYGGSRQRHQYHGDEDVDVVSEDEKSTDKNSFDRYASDRHAKLNGGEDGGIEDSYYRKKNTGLSMEKTIRGIDDNSLSDDRGANRDMDTDSHDVDHHNAFYKHQDQMAIPRAIVDDNSSPDSKESFYKQTGRPFQTDVSSDVKKYLASMNKDSVPPPPHISSDGERKHLADGSSGDKTNLSADVDAYKKKRLHSRKIDESGDLHGEFEDRYSRGKKRSYTYDKYNEDGYKKRGSGELEVDDHYSRTKKVSNTNVRLDNQVENRYSREKKHSVYNEGTYDEHGYKNRHKMDEHEDAKVQPSANRMEYETDSRHKASRKHSTYNRQHADGRNSGHVERYGDPHKTHHMHDFSKDEKSPMLDSGNLVEKEEHYSESRKHPIVPDYPGSASDVKRYAKFDQDNLLNGWKDIEAPGGISKSEDLSEDVKRYADSYEKNKYQDEKRKNSTYKQYDKFGAESKRVVDRDEEYDTASAKERFFDEAKALVKHHSDKTEQSKKNEDEPKAEIRDGDDEDMKSRRVKKMMYNSNVMDRSDSDDAAGAKYHHKPSETDGEGLVSDYALKVRPGESTFGKEYSENKRSKMKDRYAIEDSKPTKESRDLPDENDFTKKYQKRGSNSKASEDEAFFKESRESRVQRDPIDSGKNTPHSGDVRTGSDWKELGRIVGDVRNGDDAAEFSSHEKKTMDKSGSKDQAESMKRPTIDSDKTPRLGHGDISLKANRLDDIDSRKKASRKHSTYKQDGDSTLSDDVKRYRDSHQANVMEFSKDGKTLTPNSNDLDSESRKHIMGNPGRASSGDTKSYLKSNRIPEDDERANEMGSDELGGMKDFIADDASTEQKAADDSQDTDTKVNDQSYLAAERNMAGSEDRGELAKNEMVRADDSEGKQKSKSNDGNVQDEEVSREELESEKEDEANVANGGDVSTDKSEIRKAEVESHDEEVKEEPLNSSALVVSKSRSSDQEGETDSAGQVDAESGRGAEEATVGNDDEETRTELLNSLHIKSQLKLDEQKTLEEDDEKNTSEEGGEAAKAKLVLNSDDGQEQIS